VSVRAEKFRNAHLGLFIHWGSYSVWGFEASWPLQQGLISWDEYEALADRFVPEHYDPRQWAALAREAGFRYAMFTTKHHDGFAMFDTDLSDYSAPKRAAGRDFVREYAEAFREAGIGVGFYFSLCDWRHPDYPVKVVREGYDRHPRAVPPGVAASIEADPARWDRYIEFMHGQVRELLTKYGEIDYLWFDGQWEHTAEEWRSAELVAMIRELAPNCVINDRLADPSLGDYRTPEQYVPVESPTEPWETCMTINNTWGYNPHDHAYKPVGELAATLVEVRSKGGNYLLNVGPGPDGRFPTSSESRLRALGDWITRNQEAVHATGDGLPAGAYYGPSTASDSAIYLYVLGVPNGDVIRVRGLTQEVVEAEILDSGVQLAFEQNRRDLSHGFLRVHLPSSLIDPIASVIKLTVR
jgi:alpha-L-fucosidase